MDLNHEIIIELWKVRFFEQIKKYIQIKAVPSYSILCQTSLPIQWAKMEDELLKIKGNWKNKWKIMAETIQKLQKTGKDRKLEKCEVCPGKLPFLSCQVNN